MMALTDLLTLSPEADATLVLRVARKSHPCQCRCSIEHPGVEVCVETIDPGIQYLEDFNETAAYRSGKRSCPPCAVSGSWGRAGDVRYTTPLPEPSGHIYEIKHTSSSLEWRPWCECGWIGRFWHTKDDARTEAMRHAVEATK